MNRQYCLLSQKGGHAEVDLNCGKAGLDKISGEAFSL